MSPSSLTPPLFLTLTTLLLPISLSFSLKSHLHRTHPTSFLLTHLAYLLAISSYTLLVLLHSNDKRHGKDKIYASLTLLGLTTYPTLLSLALTTTTTTTPLHTQHARKTRSILLPTHILILALQLAGTGTLLSHSPHPNTTTTLTIGETLLRASLAVHGCCILALGVVYSHGFLHAFKCKEEGKHWTGKWYLLLNATRALLLVVRTLYRCVAPLAGVPHAAFFLRGGGGEGGMTEIGDGGGADGGREMGLFYVLDAGMMVCVLVAGVVAGAVMGSREGKGMEEGKGKGMEGGEGKGSEA